MARYIDADPLYALVDKAHEIVLNKFLDTPRTLSDGELNPMYIRNLTLVVERAHFKEEIFDAPIADVVEVVRCKDCKHRVFEDGSYVCDLDTWDFHELGRNAEDDNWFCADGEKRERITGKAGEKGSDYA